jgi:hypothetical protein
MNLVGAFLWYEGFEHLTDRGPDGFDGWGGGFAQQVLELGEDLLDGFRSAEFRQKEQLCADRADTLSVQGT